jgi:hypothetical protein
MELQVLEDVNGATVVDADLDAASAGGTMDDREHPGLKRESGPRGWPPRSGPGGLSG